VHDEPEPVALLPEQVLPRHEREALKIAALEFSRDSLSVQSARRTREVQLEVDRLQL
jgi:hypothetical protein